MIWAGVQVLTATAFCGASEGGGMAMEAHDADALHLES